MTIRLNENDLNQAISTLVDARAINFGDYTGAFIASAWFINLEYGSVDIKSNNQITIHAKVEARAVNIIKIIESVTVNVDLDINGILRLDQLEDGYKLVFKAQSVTNDVIRIGSWAQWSDLLSGGLSSAFIQKIPEIELCAGTKLLPDAITDYFTSSIPTLSTNENEIILYYTVGNPSTVAFNEVNQKTNIGTIEEIVNGLVFSSGNSPRTFTWGNNETHQLQTPQELLDDNNLKFKYKNWFKGDETNPIQDISPRRIQLTVDGNKNFKAKFLQAQRVQISNLLEGAYSGGTVTYGSTTSSAIDLYDYKNNTLVHPLSSTVTNGTLGRNWVFSGWSDGNTNQSRTIKVNGDLNLKANYKGSQLSGDATAYTNNSQRKIVRTKDGWLYQVYSSMNHVWIEHKSPTSSNWILGNNGQPLDNGEGKCPSIDWWYTPSGGSSPELHNLVVAYQQKEGGAYSIRYALFEKQNGIYTRLTPISNYDCFYNAVNESYTSNANPNITVGSGYFVLTFEKKNATDAGIYWIYGLIDRYGVKGYEPGTYDYDYGVSHCSGPNKITGTNANSLNASVSINKSNTDNVFDVVFEQSNTNTIRDVILACPYNNNFGGLGWCPEEVWAGNLSTSSGYKNYKPTMVQLPDNNIKVCWIRDLYGGGSNTPNYVNVVYWSSTSPNTFNYYGNMVNSVSLNIKDNSADTYFAYAQNTNNSNWQNFARNGSSTVTLSTTGRQIQLSNGPSSSAMYASAYYPVNAPYYFQTSNSLGGLLKSSGEINYGRGLYLSKGELQFNYSVKSLKVDNAGIQFVEIPENTDTNKSRRVKYLELNELNKMLLSEPFSVGAGSGFAFCDDAGFIGKEAAEQLLGKNGNIVCKIELIDDATNKTIGLINESEYTAADLLQGKITNYTLNTEGLKNTMARVKITISSNIEDLKGVFVSEYGTLDKGSLAKASVTELTLKKEGVVSEYALEQNYPNPFNPSTTIKYQIPENGMVTLKIFNILGEEVATLVNGFKASGKYEVKFDASNLASGVYVYRLSAGDFNTSHKMLLLK